MIGPDGLCRCDALEEPHAPGTIGGTEEEPAWCELLYTEPTISPHLFGVAPPGV